MKKVLVLSVLVAAICSNFIYPIREMGVRRGGATQAPANTAQQQKESNTPVTPTNLTTAQAVANAGVTLSDVAGALEDMGVSASPAGSKGRVAAKSFISTGSASMPSSNKSHKLGRLGNKK